MRREVCAALTATVVLMLGNIAHPAVMLRAVVEVDERAVAPFRMAVFVRIAVLLEACARFGLRRTFIYVIAVERAERAYVGVTALAEFYRHTADDKRPYAEPEYMP